MDVGIDIEELETFSKSYKRTGILFLEKIFTKQELLDKDLRHLCGHFSAKEALVKIGIIEPGKWTAVEIVNNKDGKPYVKWANGKKINDVILSVSHSDNFCVAVAIKT